MCDRHCNNKPKEEPSMLEQKRTRREQAIDLSLIVIAALQGVLILLKTTHQINIGWPYVMAPFAALLGLVIVMTLRILYTDFFRDGGGYGEE